MSKRPAARRPSSSSGGSAPGSAVQPSVSDGGQASPWPTVTPSSALSVPWSRHTSAPPATPQCLEPAKRPRGRPKRASSDPGPAPAPVPDAGSGGKAKKKVGRPTAEIRGGAEDASKVPGLQQKMAGGTVPFLRRLDFCKMTTKGIRAAFAGGDRSALVPPMSWRHYHSDMHAFYSKSNAERQQIVNRSAPPPSATTVADAVGASSASSVGTDGVASAGTASASSTHTTSAAKFGSAPSIPALATPARPQKMGGSMVTGDAEIPCLGISYEFLLQKSASGYSDERKQQVQDGFSHVIGEAYATKATQVSNKKWDYYGNLHGILRNKNGQDAVSFYMTENDPFGENATHVLDRVRLFHHTCEKKVPYDHSADAVHVCNSCRTRGIRALQDLCVQAIIARTKDYSSLDRTRLDVLKASPSLLVQAKIKPLMQDRVAAQKRRSYEKISAKLHADGVDIDADTASSLLKDSKPHLTKFLANETVEVKDLAAYLFDEAKQKVDAARLHGSRTIRHCPLFLRFGAIIRRQLGTSNGLYDLLAKAFGFPSGTTVAKYASPGAHEPDGVQYETLLQRQKIFDDKFPKADRLDWNRHGSLAWDSMYIRDGIVLDYHTLETLGFTEEFYSESVVRDQLRSLAKQVQVDTAAPFDPISDTIAAEAAETGKEDAAPAAAAADDGSATYPGMGKHYLVFYFTTWEKSNKMQFMAARYCLKSINSDILGPKVDEVLIALGVYGFIATSTGEDGAKENRTYLKSRATIKSRDFFSKHEDVLGKEFIASLPDLPMAFPHPLFGDEIRIFIGGDMPHCIKKLVNTLEKSGWKNHSRNLRKNGKKMSLQMIQRCWEASGDSLITTASLRKYRKRIQHFLKDSYSRLNVPLSVQITSLDSIEIINDNCEKPGIGGKDLYAPLAELLEKMDRFIDIVNCTRMNGSRYKGCEPIDAPSHNHVKELLDTSAYLESWRAECGGFTDEFITKETFEDLCWTVFGIVGVALTYLKEDKSRVMYQQRSGSDVCEHHFSMIRSGNVNPTIDACRQASARSNSAIDTHLFRTKSKANSGGAKRAPDDYFQKVHKKNKNDQYWDLDT